MARVLVAAWVGSTNLGDELVFAGLRAKLAARGAHVAAVSVDPDATAVTHGVQAVDHRDVAGLVAATGQADAVVFGGGGLLQDETSPLNLPYHLSRLWIARARHVPAAAVGVGAGRLDTRAGRMLVRRSLGAANVRAVTARDQDSARLLDAAGLWGVRLAADLAVGLPTPAVAARDRLVVCLRPWTGARGRLPAATRGDATPEPVVAAAAEALDEAAHRTGLGVHFVALQPDRDDAVHRRVAARMRQPATTATPDLDGLLDEVAAARAVVAMRYHGGIAALLAARPCVLIGYAPKVDALAGELREGGRLLAWGAEGLAGLPDALAAVTGREQAVAAARDRLRERDRVNDVVLDELLAR